MIPSGTANHLHGWPEMAKERFVMMPERLPQSWVKLTYGARTLAYDWWRTYQDEPVTLLVTEVCTALGVPARSRRNVSAWVAEMVEAGALLVIENGHQMPPLLTKRSNAQLTPNVRPVDAQRTPSDPPVDAQLTPNVRPAHTQTEITSRNRSGESASYTDRERDINTERGGALETWFQIGKLYADRYMAQTTRHVHIGNNRKHWDSIAYESEGDLELVAKSLGHFWADEFAAKQRWPVGLWAKQFLKHCDGAPDPAAEAAARTAKQRAQIARIDAEILGGKR